jgi:PQQ-dependent dehydrogenase (s-GDH family)
MTSALVLFFVAWLAAPAQNTTPGQERFSLRVVTTGLENPWEILWAPDARIWVTERSAKRITRVNPGDGSKTVMARLPDVLQLVSQDGLLGMALHSGFLKNVGTDYVYVAMTYAEPLAGGAKRMKIRRFTFDAAADALGNPTDVLSGLPAGEDHLSGRLVFGQDNKLYLTIGDGGYNQLALFCIPIRAHVLPTAAQIAAHDFREYEGKVLRVNLDGSVPTDNPTFGGVRSHIYTVGHRNAQGLVQAPDGKIYSSEHGPSMDDELNLIVGGKNYGWPYVAGFKDDKVYVYADWSKSFPQPCTSLKYDDIVPAPGLSQQKESAWNDPDFMPPLQTFFTVGPEYNFRARTATIAPSGIDVYAVTAGGIPGWANSVLVTGLSRGLIYRVKLGPGGDRAVGDSIEYFSMQTRYRDVLVSPDGRTIYAATDSTSRENGGAILAYRYEP